MIFFGPEYISDKYLPRATDLFYHNTITIFAPTGFHPIEMTSVFSYPNTCIERNIALPQIIWEMHISYLKASFNAKNALVILEPLLKKHIVISQLSFARDYNAINRCKDLIHANPNITDLINKVPKSFELISREVLSHILFEVMIEDGINGVTRYLKENTANDDKLNLLINAALINKLRIYNYVPFSNSLVNNDSWAMLIENLVSLSQDSKSIKDNLSYLSSDIFKISQIAFNIFNQVLYPIYGDCDSLEKNAKICLLLENHKEEIEYFKKQCFNIAKEIHINRITDSNLAQMIYSDLVKAEILDPLEELLKQKKQNIKNYITGTFKDSGVVASLLAVITEPNFSLFALSMGASALSNLYDLYRAEKERKLHLPSKFVLTSIKEMERDYESIQNYITNLMYSQVNGKNTTE
jgi:hypothetical protein